MNEKPEMNMNWFKIGLMIYRWMSTFNWLMRLGMEKNNFNDLKIKLIQY